MEADEKCFVAWKARLRALDSRQPKECSMDRYNP